MHVKTSAPLAQLPALLVRHHGAASQCTELKLWAEGLQGLLTSEKCEAMFKMMLLLRYQLLLPAQHLTSADSSGCQTELGQFWCSLDYTVIAPVNSETLPYFHLR